MTAITANGIDHMAITPVAAPVPPPGLDKPTSDAQHPTAGPYAAAGRDGAGGSSTVVRSVVRKWRREDLLERVGVLLRGLAAVFSLAALVVLATNRDGRGDWKNFDLYQEYRYLLAVVVIAFAYSLAQALRHANRFRGGGDLVSARFAAFVDFSGDQVTAYLLISALSSAIPITNRMREVVVNNFTNASAASISMAFAAFVALASSAILSGFKVSKQSYI